MVAIIHFFVGSIEVIIPVLAGKLSGHSASNLGFIQTLLGSGSVLMAMVISFYSIEGREVKLLFNSISSIGIIYLLIGGLGYTGAQSVFFFLLLFPAATK